MRLFAIGVALLLGITLGFLLPPYPAARGARDFVGYWAASRLLAHGEDPYDLDHLRAVQSAVSAESERAEGDVVRVWNPPWLLVSLLPYGLMPFTLATSCWMLTNMCLLVLALYLTWEMVGRPNDLQGLSYAIAAGLLYGNSISMLGMGQISSVLLVCIVLTAWALQRERYGLAGVTMLMLTIKPHVTYLVLITLVVWMARRRCWRTAVGMTMAAVASGAVATVLCPGWMWAYLHTVGQLPHDRLYQSTLTDLLYWHLGLPPWSRFAGLVLLPLSWPLSRRLDLGDWLPTFNLALLASVPLSPYGYSFDHVVLIPAVVEWIAWMRRGELPVRWRWVTAIGFGAVYVALLRMITTGLPYTWMALPAVGLAVVYLVARSVREIQYHPA